MAGVPLRGTGTVKPSSLRDGTAISLHRRGSREGKAIFITTLKCDPLLSLAWLLHGEQQSRAGESWQLGTGAAGEAPRWRPGGSSLTSEWREEVGHAGVPLPSRGHDSFYSSSILNAHVTNTVGGEVGGTPRSPRRPQGGALSTGTNPGPNQRLPRGRRHCSTEQPTGRPRLLRYLRWAFRRNFLQST